LAYKNGNIAFIGLIQLDDKYPLFFIKITLKVVYSDRVACSMKRAIL
jgi:hypothetical protein